MVQSPEYIYDDTGFGSSIGSTKKISPKKKKQRATHDESRVAIMPLMMMTWQLTRFVWLL